MVNFFTTSASANFNVTWHKTRPNIKNLAPSNWNVVS